MESRKRSRAPSRSVDDLGIFAALPSVACLPPDSRFNWQPIIPTKGESGPQEKASLKFGRPSPVFHCIEQAGKNGKQSTSAQKEELYSNIGPPPISPRKDRTIDAYCAAKTIVSQIMANTNSSSTKFAFETSEKMNTYISKCHSATEQVVLNLLPPVKGIKLEEKQKKPSVSHLMAVSKCGGSEHSGECHKQEQPKTRAHELWRKFGGEKIVNKELMVASMFKEADEHSLTRVRLTRNV